MSSAFVFGCLLLVSTVTPTSQHVVSYNPDKVATDRTYFRLGEKMITIYTLTNEDQRSFVIVSLHSDEHTALNASQEFVENEGGQMIYLENSLEHNLRFEFLNKQYSVDPNKIFTTKGRKDGLKSGPYKNQLAIEMQRFADYLFETIPHDKHVIGVHNYVDVKKSIKLFNGRKMVRKLKQVHKTESRDENDFFITTNEEVYSQLAAKDFNVVLQYSPVIRDDGSLSIAVEKNRRLYIDLVVQTGHHEEQKQMLEALTDILDKLQ
jgi:hypothetical protein